MTRKRGQRQATPAELQLREELRLVGWRWGNQYAGLTDAQKQCVADRMAARRLKSEEFAAQTAAKQAAEPVQERYATAGNRFHEKGGDMSYTLEQLRDYDRVDTDAMLDWAADEIERLRAVNHAHHQQLQAALAAFEAEGKLQQSRGLFDIKEHP